MRIIRGTRRNIPEDTILHEDNNYTMDCKDVDGCGRDSLDSGMYLWHRAVVNMTVAIRVR
jgi:hypothetical protein